MANRASVDAERESPSLATAPSVTEAWRVRQPRRSPDAVGTRWAASWPHGLEAYDKEKKAEGCPTPERPNLVGGIDGFSWCHCYLGCLKAMAVIWPTP